MIDFTHVTGKRPIIIVEGDTDRIFLEALRGVTPAFQEPDYIQLGGVEKLQEIFSLFVKSPVFHTVPAVKIIIDSDNNEGRWGVVKSLLHSENLVEGNLEAVDRLEFKQSVQGTINVGATLLRGRNPDSPDLEGLISDSQDEASNQCRLCLDAAMPNNRGYSKRLRFAERACSNTDLRDVSYHSLYGRNSGIDFDSSHFQALKDFLILS